MTSEEANRSLVREVSFGRKARIVIKGVKPDLDRTKHPAQPTLLQGATAPNSDAHQVRLQETVVPLDLPKKRRHSKQP